MSRPDNTTPPGHSDPRVPPRDRCVVRYLIDRWAAERGDQVYVIFDAAQQWTYRELRERVISVAVGLQRQGVKQGDFVLCWQPTSPEMLLTYYALNYLGAIFVPINTAYRGGLLDLVIANSGATIAIVHADLVPRLKDVKLASLERLIVTGPGDPASAPLPAVPFASLAGKESELQPLARPIEPWDTQSIIYTSGTTGPSKGVLSS